MMTAAPDAIRSPADLAGRRAVVLGLARSGVAAARFLAHVGAEVTAYDRRSEAELADEVAALEGRPVRLALGVPVPEAQRLLGGADLLVTSPSVSARFPTTDPWLRDALLAAEARGLAVVSEVDLFLRLTRARVLAVTGTKGKTTTATLAAAMLEAAGVPHALGGNVGRPLIEEVERLGEEHWAVLELSELQLPTISRGADVAAYTNIGADHLDRHGSVEAYRAVKARLAELSAATGTLVLNADDPGCRELDARLVAPDVAWYGLRRPEGGARAPSWVADGMLLLAGQPLLPTADVPLPGAHIVSDVLAAATAAELAGARPDAIADAIRGFGGVPHRLETVVVDDGVRYVNDSQATIPAAAIAGLEAFDAPVVLIAGGKDKGLDYAAFTDAIARCCRAVILIGETAGDLERLIAGRVPTVRAADMSSAVRAAAGRAASGDVVLLAPAAASFDMFDDNAARGDAFRSAVADLASEPESTR
jgi:UDP-N-acetylmuramoylalanine--D-glutamate ligase